MFNKVCYFHPPYIYFSTYIRILKPRSFPLLLIYGAETFSTSWSQQVECSAGSFLLCALLYLYLLLTAKRILDMTLSVQNHYKWCLFEISEKFCCPGSQMSVKIFAILFIFCSVWPILKKRVRKNGSWSTILYQELSFPVYEKMLDFL